MKILILTNFDVGLYQFRRELIQGLLDAGHEVILSLPDGALVRPLEEMGCAFFDAPLERRGMNPVKDAKLLVYYLRLLRQVRPDLVITYTVKPNVYGGLACVLRGVPYAANVTGLGSAFQQEGLLRRVVTLLYRIGLQGAKVVFFENSANAATAQRAGIVEPERCRVLNGAGVNLTHYTPAEYPAEEGVRFLFVGRIMAEKGVRELLSAMERLHREGADCTLDVLGEFEEASLRPALQQAQEAGWLRYHGYREDVRPYIAQSHCFVLPSYHEGMANTNLECAAMARPLITSRIPGCMEAVEEDVSGFLCTPQDADSLCEAMRRFLQLDHERRRAMGLAARAHVAAKFDKKQVVNATLEGLGL